MKNFLKTMLIAAALCFAGSGHASAQTQADIQLAKALLWGAQDAYDAGNYSEALEMVEKAEQTMGAAGVQTLLVKTKSLYKLERYEDARSAASQFYSLNPNEDQQRELAPILVSIEEFVVAEREARIVAAQRKAEADRRQAAAGLAEVFRDALSGGSQGPEMVVVPAGSFTMGSPAGEAWRNANEGPQRTVRIGYSFAVGKTEVTWAEWEACVADRGCSNSGPDAAGGDESWGKADRPVINVSWEDAQAYVRWLSGKTGEKYRLLSEAEWEYVARAGTRTPFSFGETISTDQANYDGNNTYGSGVKGEYREKTTPVGSFPANAFGLYDLHGNVWEWTEDCWNNSYNGAPTNGSAWMSGDCSLRVLRGGSWVSYPQSLRSAIRVWIRPANRDYVTGFRVARTL